MKIYVVGEALSRQGDGRPLSGPSGERLARLCGVPTPDLRQLFTLMNLSEGYGWSNEEAELKAVYLRRRLREGDSVILLGRRVESRFAAFKKPWFQAWDLWGATFYTTPHPSGLNHWWNEPRNVREAQEFWGRMARSELAIR